MSLTQEGMCSGNACVVCYKNVDVYSIGMCEHPVCYECSTRMRVLCRQNECPICRQDLPKVVFTREVKPFRELAKGILIDVRYNIYFDSLDIQEKFDVLLTNMCTICKDKPIFESFVELKDHMRHRHKLFYCDLCVENLKIFSYERRYYTRWDLALHRRKGDVDDKSHKGHPLCEFCDQRYMDNDELYRHLRRDHLYCHFCDADGLHQYYSSYDYLREHFRQEHFLCEEGQCLEEKFTSVFRTDIDLKAHKSSVHCKQLSKAEAKQARTIQLELALATPGDGRSGPMYSSTGSWIPRNFRHASRHSQRQHAAPGDGTEDGPPAPTFVRQPSVDLQSTEEFPRLGNAAGAGASPTGQGGQVGQGGQGGQSGQGGMAKGPRSNLMIRSTVRPQPLAITDENFPALGPEPSGLSKTVNFRLTSSAAGPNTQQTQKGSTPNLSIQVNHEANGTVTTRVSGPNIRIRPAHLSIDSDFPALRNSAAEPSSSAGNPTHWKEVVRWTCSKSGQTAKKPASPPIGSGEDFPTLGGKSSKFKKQSSITVVPSWSQSRISDSSNTTVATASTTTATATTTTTTATTNTTTTTSTTNAINSYSKASNDMTKGKTRKKKIRASVTETGNTAGTTKRDPRGSAELLERGNEREVLASVATVNEEEPQMALERTKKESRRRGKGEMGQESSSASTATTATTTTTVGNPEGGFARKRTELKIERVSSSKKNGHEPEEFPGMSGCSKSSGLASPPPGFRSSPGPAGPPPGFCIKYDGLERGAQSGNGLTFTSSSGESYSILPNGNKLNGYVPPPEFHKRNKSLVAKVNQVLMRQDEIEEFRYVSGLFRQGTCDAQSYYAHCKLVMGEQAFENVFPELLVLLPDIPKQQELYRVYKEEIAGRAKELELCADCGQVSKAGADFRTHLTSHTMENHFPALGKTSATTVKNSWVRK